MGEKESVFMMTGDVASQIMKHSGDIINTLQGVALGEDRQQEAGELLKKIVETK